MRNIKLLIMMNIIRGGRFNPRSNHPGDSGRKIGTSHKRVHPIGRFWEDGFWVHALGQVAHFKTQSQMDIRTIQRALNSLLPPDIVIQKAEEVEEGFHARKHSKVKFMNIEFSIEIFGQLFIEAMYGICLKN